MELVELLARELGEWPEVAEWVVSIRDPGNIATFGQGDHPAPDQGDRENHTWTIMGSHNPTSWVHIHHQLSEEPTDRLTAIVTREMWEAERARIAGIAIEPAASENVAAFNAQAEIAEKETSHMEVNIVEVFNQQIEQIDGPIKWRDRIREIDKTVEALEEERAALAQQLEGEGFQLIAAKVKPDDDMGDWRNWKVGDLIERVGGTSKYYTNGEFYAVERNNMKSVWLQDDCNGNHQWSGDGPIAENFKFHSRP